MSFGTFARYENTKGTSNKFWQITLRGGSVEAEWGRIEKGAQGSKFYTIEDALKLVQEKVKKGYQLVEAD